MNKKLLPIFFGLGLVGVGEFGARRLSSQEAHETTSQQTKTHKQTTRTTSHERRTILPRKITRIDKSLQVDSPLPNYELNGFSEQNFLDKIGKIFESYTFIKMHFDDNGFETKEDGYLFYKKRSNETGTVIDVVQSVASPERSGQMGFSRKFSVSLEDDGSISFYFDRGSIFYSFLKTNGFNFGDTHSAQKFIQFLNSIEKFNKDKNCSGSKENMLSCVTELQSSNPLEF